MFRSWLEDPGRAVQLLSTPRGKSQSQPLTRISHHPPAAAPYVAPWTASEPPIRSSTCRRETILRIPCPKRIYGASARQGGEWMRDVVRLAGSLEPDFDVPVLALAQLDGEAGLDGGIHREAGRRDHVLSGAKTREVKESLLRCPESSGCRSPRRRLPTERGSAATCS